MTTMTQTISVLLVDDHRLVLEGMRALLKEHDDLEVVGTAEDGVQALEVAAELKPDVMVLDVSMPRMGGLEVLANLMDWNDAPAVIICSMHEQVGESAMALGARAFVEKRSVARNLVRAIRDVAEEANAEG